MGSQGDFDQYLERSDPPIHDSADLPGRRLRLKRWFLRTLVASLTCCALVAVFALLLASFNRTTGRILLTLGALATHSGIAMACSASLERRLWPKLSLFGLAAFGVNFCVLIPCIWWPGGPGEPALRAILATAALVGYYILATPCADLQERNLWPPWPLLGLSVCGSGLVMLLVVIWAPTSDNVEFGKATAIAAILAFSLAHTCVLLRLRRGRSSGWLLASTLACVWGVAAMASAAIVFEPNEDVFYRFFGALGVLDASGSLSLIIMAKLAQIGKVEKLETASARVELRCPRCTLLQVLDVGKAKCAECGLKITIEIEEPRCAKCDYLLWQLPERRCPECGTPF